MSRDQHDVLADGTPFASLGDVDLATVNEDQAGIC